MKKLYPLLICFLPLVLYAQPQRYYVDLQAGGQANGQSWTDAFTDLHDALALALPGDEVWVAQGTYRPAVTDRSAHYRLPSGVRLYGGFAGTEMVPDERQPDEHPTILSGDIGTADDSTDNSYNLLYLPYPDANTLVDGFIMRDALANDPAAETGALGAAGGALYLLGADSIAYPTLRHCTFEHNTARTNGGAVYVDGSGTGSVAPLFRECRFRHNRALLNGGALYKEGASWWERPGDVTGCTFEYNRAQRGGCIYIDDANRKDTLQITRSSFYRNYAANQADVICWGRARTVGASAMQISACEMIENLNLGLIKIDNLYFQGGMWLHIDSSMFKSNAANISSGVIVLELPIMVQCIIANCSFSNASANQNHDISIGVDTYSVLQDTTVIIANSSFQNIGVSIGGNKKMLIDKSDFHGKSVYITYNRYDLNNCLFDRSLLNFEPSSHVLLQNCTLYKNKSESGIIPAFTDSIVEVNNCIFQPTKSKAFLFKYMKVKAKNCLFTDSLYAYPAILVTGPNVQIGPDPLFVDTLNNDFHLQPCSPAWNAGNNASAQGLTADLDGRPRIVDGTVDMGAYEVGAMANAGPVTVQAACFGAPEGAVQWTLENACLPVTYQWTKDGAGSGSQLSGLAPGNYLFTVTDSRGRNLVQSVPIPTSSPEVQLDGDTLICAAMHDGDLLALVGGAAEPVQYQWSTGATAGSIAGLGVGSYAVTVTDAIGCQDVATATVGSLSVPLGLSVQNNPASTLTAADGSLVVTVQSGQGPFTYVWAEVAGTQPGIAGLLPGVYHLSITDGAGCVTPFTFEVGAVSATAEAEPGVPGAVWPNPARGQVMLDFGDATRWRVFDLDGREVLRVDAGTPGQTGTVGLGALPPGTYFYKFERASRVLGRDRLVILAP